MKPHGGSLTRAVAAAAATLVGAMLPVVVASPAGAATYAVTTNADSGAGSLRDAIDQANANPGTDTITIAALTITLPSSTRESANANGDFDVSESVIIEGAGSSQTILDGNSLDRLFEGQGVGDVHMTFSDLTLRDGSIDDAGGAVSTSGTVTMTDVVVDNNVATGPDGADGTAGAKNGQGGDGILGGGIFAGGDVIATNSTVSNNAAQGGTGGDGYDDPATSGGTAGAGGATNGGGIYAGDDVTLTNTDVTGNASTGGNGGDGGNSTAAAGRAGGTGGSGNGGGVYAGGDVTVADSEISGNTALSGTGGNGGTGSDGGNGGTGSQSEGGGIRAIGNASLTDSVVSDNSATGSSGGTGANADSGNAGVGGDAMWASGGGLSVSTNLTLNDTDVTGNTAQGGDGGTGGLCGGAGANAGSGGIGLSGVGGGVAAASTTATDSLLETNQALGGNGAAGRAGTSWGSGNGCDGGNGGGGGGGQGGAIDGPADLTLTAVTGNTAQGGNGGNGGVGGDGDSGGAGGDAGYGGSAVAGGVGYDAVVLSGVTISTNNATSGNGGTAGAGGAADVSATGGSGGDGGNAGSASGGGVNATTLAATDSTIFGNTLTIGTSGNGGNGTAGTSTVGAGGHGGHGGTGDGGGVLLDGPNTGLELMNLTVSGNTVSGGAAGTGGTGGTTGNTGASPSRTSAGMFIGNDAVLVNSTIYGDTFGTTGIARGVRVTNGTLSVLNSIIAGTTGNECEFGGAAITSMGGNVSDDQSCNFAGGSDQQDTDPDLQAIGDNGGPTSTHLPDPDSPVIDAGVSTGAEAISDQRGLARPIDGDDDATATIDAGAVEVRAKPDISIDDISGGEGETLSFALELSGESDYAVTAEVDTGGGTATEGADYDSGDSLTASVPAHDLGADLDIEANQDTIDEPGADETFTVTLSNPGNAGLGDATATGSIADDDTTPVLSVDDQTVTEGGTATFTVSASHGSSVAMTVDASTANGTAVAGSDFTAVTGAEVTIPAGSTSATRNVVTTNDSADEPAEAFTLNLSGADNATLTGGDATGSGTINDNDNPPGVSVGNAPAVTEGDSGTRNAVFPVRLSTASGKTVTVTYATRAGTARRDVDYVHETGTLTFMAGQTLKNVTVAVRGDRRDEFNESVFVDLTSATNATRTDSTGKGVITDDDPLVLVSIDSVARPEGDDGTRPFTFDVELNRASDKTVKVDFRTVERSAVSPSDFGAKSGTLTFSPGQTSKTVVVNVRGDTTVEPDEVFKVKLSNARNAAFDDDVGRGTVRNDD